MLRISKLADYGMLIMNTMVIEHDTLNSAKEIAEKIGVGLPTVSKLLKILVKAGLVESVRGSEGGYRLAQKASHITLAHVISAIEGIPALTECAAGEHICAQEAVCSIRTNWLLVNKVILKALNSITLADMTRSMIEHPVVLHKIKGLKNRYQQ